MKLLADIICILKETLALINHFVGKAENEGRITKEKADELRKVARQAMEDRDYNLFHQCLRRMREL